jgi:hypothetical protein
MNNHQFSRKKTVFTPEEAAKVFIKKYMRAGPVVFLYLKKQLFMETRDFTAKLQDRHIIISRFYGVPVHEKFPLRQIQKKILEEIINSLQDENK